MIKLIAAIDSYRGIANSKGIPWDLPTDSKNYKNKVTNGEVIIMGYGTYVAHSDTLKPNTTEYVYLDPEKPSQSLRNGFKGISDLATFFTNNRNVWVLGGSQLFELALPYADELYITQVDGDFGCTKFFPSFEHTFEMVKKSPIQKENRTLFQYQVWKPCLTDFNDVWDNDIREDI